MTRQATSIRNEIEHDRAILEVARFAVSEQRYIEAESAAKRSRIPKNHAAALRFVALCMGLDRHPGRADAAANRIKDDGIRDEVKRTLLTIRLTYLELGPEAKLALEGEQPCRMEPTSAQ